MTGCVLPVAAADALAWAQGRLMDSDILLRSPLVPEAIFLVNLPSRAAARRTLALIIHWYRRGAVCLITRTAVPLVAKHLRGMGAVLTHTEPHGDARYLMPPAALKAYCARFASHQAA